MADPKRAFITGITGQDGSYLAELLLDKGYTVFGMVRRCSTFNTDRIDHIYQDPHVSDYRLRLINGDMTDPISLERALLEARPDEVYNLAAQSHVKVSFEVPAYTAMADAVGTISLLEAVRRLFPEARVYQASTSEMFGGRGEVPQNENTRFDPRSPYGAAKVYAHHVVCNYREAYGLFICNGILFNHESPRRGRTFVTRKISRAAAMIKLGMQDKLYLGNLESKRDWGYAKDFVEGMWLMLQRDAPDDFVLATGETHSVREFCEAAFSHLDLDYKDYVEIDPRYYRPTEVDLLHGDPTKAKEKLGWEPKVKFEELVRMMVDADYADLEKHGDDAVRARY